MVRTLTENFPNNTCIGVSVARGKPWLGTAPAEMPEEKAGKLEKCMFADIPETLQTEEGLYKGSVQKGKKHG